MRKILLVALTIFTPILVFGQDKSESKEVIAVIQHLFEGYRQGDSSMVSATFAKGAMMQRVGSRDGVVDVSEPRSVQAWLDYVGSGLEKKHDEPIWDYAVHIDNGLASVWTKFAFYLDGEFSHCGVDNFLLVKKPDGWKIFHIVDTNQKVGCDIPKEIKAKHQKG